MPPLIAQQELLPAVVARVAPLIVSIGPAGHTFAPAAFGPLCGSGQAGATGTGALFLCAVAIQLAAISSWIAGRITKRARQRPPASRPRSNLAGCINRFSRLRKIMVTGTTQPMFHAAVTCGH
ncbi:MAG: hypothetical protein V7668_13205 [Cereibacter changlensis]|uniref:Uncharacterized protein n=1 Tax=Cereibacter changlensis JA139 TaxID=1188249 RepID=A0A2T4JPJ3_9RHOB|nr:hypothetical protein C5F48_21070 [Cereibacter changlensis JA139]